MGPKELFSQLRGAKKYTNSVVSTIFSSLRMTPTTTCSLATRFDSFSKILSSGIRLGFVTGPKELIQRIVLHMQVSVLHASSLSQVVTLSLLDQWGLDGFHSHVAEVEDFYRRRRDKMVEAA